MNADFVVDASGRGSSARLGGRVGLAQAAGGADQDQPWLRDPAVPSAARTLAWQVWRHHRACPPDWRFGVILSQEGDRWIVTLGGYLGDHAPTDDNGFVDFARSLQKPEIFDLVRVTEPLSPLMPYQFSANLRRRYEEPSRFPAGFLVFGDALCSFNPVYGQGMTVACMEWLALRECLAAGTQEIAGRFLRAASRLIDVPWQIAVGSDLRFRNV